MSTMANQKEIKSMQPTVTHSQFKAAHASHMAELAAVKKAEVDAAEARRAAAEVAHAVEHGSATAAHEAEELARLIAYQRRAAAAFIEPLALLFANPTRVTVAEFQKAFAAIDADRSVSTARTNTIPELAFAVGAHHLLANPDALKRLCVANNWHEGLHGSAFDISGRACRALLMRTTPGAALTAVLALEEAVSTLATTGQATHADAAPMWEALRFSGSGDATTAALAALNEKHQVKLHGTHEQRQANFYKFKESEGAVSTPKSWLESATDAATNLLFGSHDSPSGSPPRQAPAVTAAQAKANAAFESSVAAMARSVPVGP